MNAPGEKDKTKRPEKIGRYEIEKLLGKGGMGCVYLARDSILKRQVAVKVLRDDLDIPPQARATLTSRMRNEAQAAAALSHPNIVTLHDMGEDPVVGLFLVFEYIDGESMRGRIKDAPLSLEEVATISRALGRALSAGHAAGVIHRDIKPENVLLSKTGPKIADFGVARVPDSMITQANVVLGTPAYTAPEALTAGDYSAASDQFSFAATLYEALTGARAFAGSDPLTVASSISTDDPPPLEAVEADPRIVARMNGVLRRGLAKNKADRYASCEDFGAALAIAIESRVITDAPSASPRPPQVLRESQSAVSIETPVRPSLVIRQKTHRAQNLFAALGLIVIVGLVLFGRRTQEESPLRDAASAFQSATEHPGSVPSAPPTHVIPVHTVHGRDGGGPHAEEGIGPLDEALDKALTKALASDFPEAAPPPSAAPTQSAVRPAPPRPPPDNDVFDGRR